MPDSLKLLSQKFSVGNERIIIFSIISFSVKEKKNIELKVTYTLRFNEKMFML